MKYLLGIMLSLLMVTACCGENPPSDNPCEGKEDGFVVSKESPCVDNFCQDGGLTVGNSPKGTSCEAEGQTGLCDGQQVCALCDGKYPGEVMVETECQFIYCATNMPNSLVAHGNVAYVKEECK